MLYLGLLCLIYYMTIRIYTGRKDTTFLPFWLITGILCIICGVILHFLPEGIQENLWLALGIPFLVFLAAEIIICSAMLQNPQEGLRFIIVLGAQVRGQRVTDSLRRRLDRAEKYLRENPGTKAILSGGQGPGEEITEAEAMYQYLTGKGIEKDRLIREKTSTSTWENLRNSQAFIRDLTQPVGVVTNNFHIYRALLMGRNQGYRNLQGLTASANPVLFPNYLVREFFACMKSWLVYRGR